MNIETIDQKICERFLLFKRASQTILSYNTKITGAWDRHTSDLLVLKQIFGSV